MKNFLISLMILVTVNSASACIGEAQIIAKITKIEKTMSSCRVFVNPLKVQFYAENQICPLDLSEIATHGVEVGLKDGHDCGLDTENDLNGIVFVNGYGKIELEK